MGTHWKAGLALLAGLLAFNNALFAHGADGGAIGLADGKIVARYFTGTWDQVDQESPGRRVAGG